MKKFIIVLISLLLLTISVKGAEINCDFENNVNSFKSVTNTLSYGGSVSFTNGFVGKGIELNGTYGLEIGQVNDCFTVSAMVNITSGGGTETVFFKNMGTSSQEKWTSVIYDEGTPALWAHGGNYSWSRLITSGENTLSRWAYITYTEENGIGKLYVNGKLAGSSNATVSSGTIYAASTYWSADAPNGIIDEIYFNNSVALTENQIMSMYTNLAIQNVSIPKKTIADISLPETIGNAQVSWVSSDESVISNEGKVTRGEENETVTLSLYMDNELIETYNVTVLKNAQHTNDEVLLSYIFDETTEAVVEDVSGNGNHGTIFGAMVGTHFDGVDDYVELPENLLANSQEFTIVMGLKSEIAKTHQFTFCFGSGTNKYFFLNTSRPTTNTLRLAITENGAGAEKDVASIPGIREGEHAQLAIAVKGSEATMYKNGIPVAFGDLGISPAELGNTTDNWLAKSPYNDPYFKGDIYEFTVYSKALELSEIESMHYTEPLEKSYIEKVETISDNITVYLNRFCMMSAICYDSRGKMLCATTKKVSGDNLTVDFTLPENTANVELAAYDAHRGIIKDKMAVAMYDGVVAYYSDGENIKITNTTAFDKNVSLVQAVYNGDILKDIKTIPVKIKALSYTVVENPVEKGGKLMVWYSVKSMEPALGLEN